jgi:putative oxidoreductase
MIRRALGRRGGMEGIDVGLLVLRLVVGLLLIGHGTQKLFGWFGGYGLAGTGGWMESIGYRPGRTHAAVAGLAETGGGLLLALGFLTPLGAAAVIGVMVNAAMAVHRPHGLWVTDNGMEYVLVLSGVAAALAFAGPGEASLDAALDLGLNGIGWGLGALALGLLAAAAVLGSRRAEPAHAAHAAREDEVRGEAETAVITER